MHEKTVSVDGIDRAYRLAVPDSTESPRGLVVAFHGAGETPQDMARYSQLDSLANEGWAVAYPAGRNGAWLLAGDRFEADVVLFDMLVADVAKEHSLDATRVYLVGMSQGASFIHALAHERSEMVEAIAAHSGEGTNAELSTAPTHRYRVLLIHGQADTQIDVARSRAVRQRYESWGHEVELIEVPGLEHAWAKEHGATQRIQQFFAK